MRRKIMLCFCIGAALIFACNGVSAHSEAPPHRFAECKSHNVWDDGFVLRFDLLSYTRGADPRIEANIYELVPLWRKELVHSGPMAQTGPGFSGTCEFELIAIADAPASRISFKISDQKVAIHLEELNGVRPERWAELECDPKITALLASYCVQRQTQPEAQP